MAHQLALDIPEEATGTQLEREVDPAPRSGNCSSTPISYEISYTQRHA